MVRIEDHEQKMKEIKQRADKETGETKRQLTKCYHKLLKQLLQCKIYIKGSENHGSRQTEIQDRL